jgi:hypothetical protein
MNNVLTAVSEAGTASLITKNDFGGLTIRVNVPGEPGGGPEVPEPGSLAFIALALLPLIAGRRFRQFAPGQ